MDPIEIFNSKLCTSDNESDIYKFVHACVDEITIDNKITYKSFNNLTWTREEFQCVRDMILKLLQNPSSLYGIEEKMPLDYHGVAENGQKVILNCIQLRQKELTEILVENFSSNYHPTLHDFDWRIKYVMGSSKLACIKECLVQINLMLKNKQNIKNQELELNLEELNKVINVLQNIDQNKDSLLK